MEQLCADIAVWLLGSLFLHCMFRRKTGSAAPGLPGASVPVLTGVGACRDLEKKASQKQRDARPALDKIKLAEETVEAAEDQVRRAEEYAQNADEELKAAVEQLR